MRLLERKMAGRTPKIDPNESRRQLVELVTAYSDGTLGTPSPFFPAPAMPDVKVAPQGDGPLGTYVHDLTFRSDYVPFLPSAREHHLAIVENSTAHVRRWTSGRGRPTIVVLHGWRGGSPWVTERTFAVAYWLKHGYDVAAFCLPFHGARAPGPSGALFPFANPLRTNEGFGQAIHDLRALAMWLRDRGSTDVGVMGMSLGGYTASLWASVDPQLAFSVAMIPAVSIPALMWRHGEASPARKRAEAAGINAELLADAFAVHAPTTRKAQIETRRLFVIAGRGDRITPPDQAEMLAKHWGVPVHWFEGGHLAQLGRADAFRDVRRALGDLGLAGRAFRG